MPSTDVKILVPGNHLMVPLLGQRDELLRLIQAAFPGVAIHVRGNEISVTGEGADLVGKLFEELVVLVEKGHQIDATNVGRTIQMVRDDERPSEVLTTEVLRAAKGKPVRPKTSGQKRYVDAIRDNVITFAIGPAGTGKSWLAVAMAVQALQAKQVNRIILTRPAVEAGERLGFLPGDLMAKVDPYLRPLFDALYVMVDAEAAVRLLERNTVEVAPLAFMRGRAQPVDTPVLTPEGWQPIGSLRVGDLVTGSDGAPTPVLGVFPQGERDVFRVTAQDGASTVCCAEHLWFVRTLDDKRHGKAGRVLRTDEMIGTLRRHHQRRYELPMLSAPVQFDRRSVPMDPYALGLLLGDGCMTLSTTPSFTTADPDLAEALEACFDGVELVRTSAVDYTLYRSGRGGGSTANPVTVMLRELDLAGTRSTTKFVPPEYLYNSPEVRIAVLQGLLDSDGGPVVQARRHCRIQFTTCSAKLRDDVVFLVRSLGGVAYTRTRPAEGRAPGRARGRAVHHRADAHILDIRLPAGIEPFRLERKRVKYEFFGAGRPMRTIESIEPAGSAETVCIQVGAADSLYVTDDFLLTHNTLNSAFIILDEAQNATPEQMKMFLTRVGFGSKVVVTGDVTQIDVPSGRSGLVGLDKVLTGIEGLEFVYLTHADVVRHRIVQDIVNAYEQNGQKPT
ncbi:MAG: phosphate starvation-inducible protein PhoH [Actinomycetota bacterium]|nr:phosphate starvation-inducible protein PhoH [Actinomycetota bacterium]